MPPRRAARRARGLWVATIAVVVVAGITITALLNWSAVSSWYGGVSSPKTPGVTASGSPSPTVSSGPVDAAILPPLGSGAAPVASVLKGKLDAIPHDGAGTVSAFVGDSTGATLYALGDAPQRPASTEKIVTALATLDLIDPQTRFATRVMSTAAGHIVLVGGGDPMLTSNPTATYPAEPSTEELAVATAAALTKQGVTQVTLGYDGSLFSGPGRHPSWTPNYDWGVTTVSGLMVDHGIGGGPEDRRQPDPSAVAGQRFAAQLRAHGLQVDAVTPEVTPASATEVARVSSMPVGLIIQQALLNSDNDAAEALFRQVAIAAGRPGTFADAAAVVQDRLAAHGLWQDGTVITDGCGLGRDSRIRPAQLAGMVRLALSDARYRPLLDGLPVAGALGTLKNRFTVPQALPGRGDVRGKTGTLNDTANLAGYAVTADGATVTFAFLSTEGNKDRGEVWIDASAGTLAACGCAS